MATANPPEVARTQGVALLDKNQKVIAVKPMPLPGVVIFVHGVNSEGEWFVAAEKGLCAGLNRRLGRLDDQMAHKGPAAGQLTPASYINSLTSDGFINPKMSSKTYIQDTPSFSPVIHFRWGYRANKEEMREYGGNVFLNEQNYWGGGPFANGCSSLPDLWNEGVNDRLFLWITVQDINPVDARQVYSTPARNYGVMGALRLAKLIESIRKKQADAPITVVCHSQGNMVGIAAAFLGDRLPPVTDQQGKSGRCVADSYVLTNPPYSLVTDLTPDSYAQRSIKDSQGERGRETFEARAETLANYFQILRERANLEMDPAKVDKEMANSRPSANGGKPYSAAADRAAHGLKNKTYGRVTLYCCPHDQVISASTVQGIGWRGMSMYEMAAARSNDVFTQRVFASGFTVGQDPTNFPLCDYWKNDWRYGKGETPGFWFPSSPKANFSLTRSLHNHQTVAGKVATFMSRHLLSIVNVVKLPVNANPPQGWAVAVTAPKLDQPFTPKAIQYGQVVKTSDGPNAVSDFNEGNDPPASARDKHKAAAAKQKGDALDEYQGSAPALGDADSEAAQRYEDHALVREEARRTSSSNGSLLDDQGQVVSEQPGYQATSSPAAFSHNVVQNYLKKTETNNPTNHSTIMTNPEHAEKALAYDVAIGVCHLSDQDLYDLRVEADWRFSGAVDKSNPNKKYSDYFATGKMGGSFLSKWIKNDPDAQMPKKIVDERDGWLLLDAARFL
jgi:pimeloyl-ACP methyl ester carboxylesterase